MIAAMADFRLAGEVAGTTLEPTPMIDSSFPTASAWPATS
jgi:hypothetical protein